MGRGLPVGRHEIATAAEASSMGWTLARPTGRTVLLSALATEQRTAELVEILASDAVRRQGGSISTSRLDGKIRDIEDLRALRERFDADEAVALIDARTAARLGVADVDPVLYEGVAVSVTDDSFSARPVAADLPVVFADSYAPYFVRNLFCGELRTPDHAHFARIARTAEFRAAFERLVRALVPGTRAAEHLAALDAGRLDPVAVSDLLAGIGSDTASRYEAKRAFLRALLKIVDEQTA